MRNQQSIPVSAGVTVMIQCGSDLRVLSHDEPSVVVWGDEDESVRLSAPAANTVQISGDGDLQVRVPADANVIVTGWGGDVKVYDVAGSVKLENVGGDLELRRVGPVMVGTIGGDLRLRDVKGTLQVDEVGGDAELEMTFASGTECVVSAGGDIRCNLLTGSSATIKAQCDGDLNVNVRGVHVVDKDSAHLIVVGGGDGVATFTAGGDVTLRDVDGDFEGIDDLAGSIEEMVTRQLSGGMQHVTAAIEQGGLTIQRSLDEAQRKVAEVERRADAAGRRSRHWGVVMPPEAPRAPEAPAVPEAHEPVSDDERLTILRMVETGKITAAQAAQLLTALEGK